jgi:hypothetical protein
MTEGMLCSLTVSSSVASSTLHFECLGFEELAEKNEEKGENSTKLSNCKLSKSTHKFKKRSHLGVSSSSPPGKALALRFRAVTRGFFG